MNQSPGARRVSFCAHHPPDGDPTVPRWLLLKELPCRGTGLEFLRVGGRQFADGILKGIDSRPGRIPRKVSFQPCRRDKTGFSQSFEVADVYSAPNAPWLSRCESVRVADGVHTLHNAVNPAEAKRFGHSLGVSEATLSGAFLEEAYPQLACVRMVCLQPVAESGSCFEKTDVHILETVSFAGRSQIISRSSRLRPMPENLCTVVLRAIRRAGQPVNPAPPDALRIERNAANVDDGM